METVGCNSRSATKGNRQLEHWITWQDNPIAVGDEEERNDG
jgi:hypothetical protein